MPRPLSALAACAVLLLPALAAARAWNGITPQESTKADAVAKFGQPTKAVKQGDREVLAWFGDQSIKGTTQTQIALNKGGKVETITVFPLAKLELSDIEDTYGKACAGDERAQGCYVKQLADDFKTYFWYKKIGLMVFFNEDKKSVHSIVFNAPVGAK